MGSLRQRTVIVGGSDHIDAVADVFARESWLGYHVVGALTPPHELATTTQGGVRRSSATSTTPPT